MNIAKGRTNRENSFGDDPAEEVELLKAEPLEVGAGEEESASVVLVESLSKLNGRGGSLADSGGDGGGGSNGGGGVMGVVDVMAEEVAERVVGVGIRVSGVGIKSGMEEAAGGFSEGSGGRKEDRIAE